LNFKFKSRKRRGLSSVVGALFFIVLMIATFTALLAAFSYQNDLIDTQRTMANLEVAKSHENFIVKGGMEICSGILVPPNDKCLQVTVYNKGTNPVEVGQLWVIQKATPFDAKPYNQKSLPPLKFQDLVVPIATSKDITIDSIQVETAREYSIKVVSKLGTIVTADVPDTCPQCQQGEEGQACWDINNNGVPDPVLDPLDPASLGFDTEDRNDDTFINAIDCIGATGSPGPTPVIDDDLLNKPAIFAMFPSPFGIVPGTSTSKGYWGAIVANPSENDMTVNKIVITTILTGAAAGETSFPSGCAVGVGWSCGNNQLIWEGTPVVIPTRSAYSFLTTVKPDNTIAKNQNGMPVFASVLTSFGQFGKTAYLSSIIKTTNANFEAPIVNVYRSNSPDSTTDIQGDLVLPPATSPPTSFSTHFTIAEFSNDDGFIKSGAELIVNVPKKFTAVSGATDSPGIFTVTTTGNDVDGWQVRGVLNENVGDGVVGHENARSITVTATPPVLDPIDKDKLTVFFVVATGSASHRTSSGNPLCPTNCAQWEIGPLAEVVVKIDAP
jgi:hypothetical protein